MNRKRFLDLAAPGSCLPTSRFDESLKSFQISLHAQRDGVTLIIYIFNKKTLGEIGHVQADLRSRIRKGLKHHNAVIDGAISTGPGNALVRRLLGNLRVPLLFLSRNV